MPTRPASNVVEVRSGIQDVLSVLYYVRTRPLEVGQEIVVDVNSGPNYPMVIRVLGRETTKVGAGVCQLS